MSDSFAVRSGIDLPYDAAGNLARDEDGRGFAYDEHNRLTRVYLDTDGDAAFDDGETVLANYTYDALGRRIAFEDPVAGVTTRYYYDGQRVIEERDGTDAVTRYHVNGAQFIDEHVATYDTGVAAARDSSPHGGEGRVRGRTRDDVTLPQPLPDREGSHGGAPERGTGEPVGSALADHSGPVRAAGWTYYLLNANYSVAGTGNSDGSVIERLDYSSGGDFGDTGGPPLGDYYFDADDDGDVDLDDYADFYACFAGPGLDSGPACDRHDWEGDYDIDAADFAALQVCYSGDGGTPPVECLLSPGPCFAYYFDADFDGDIDLSDHAELTTCLAGPEVNRIPTCSTHDWDADYDVDLADHAAFAQCYSGDGLAPAAGCCQPTLHYHDADADGDVDLTDWASFTMCFEPGAEGSPYCVFHHDFAGGPGAGGGVAGGRLAGTHAADGQVDLSDQAGFWTCFAGPRTAPPPECRRDVNPTRPAGDAQEGTGQAPGHAPSQPGTVPPSGTFTLHGRPIDVLSDPDGPGPLTPLVLMNFRNRVYLPQHGRWLQRDPTGYTDGAKLYESFATNPSTESSLVSPSRPPAGRHGSSHTRSGGCSTWPRGTSPRTRSTPITCGS